MQKLYYVYIVTNKWNKVLYTGVTGNLEGRVYQHKNKVNEGFTKKYNVDKLLHYEFFDDVTRAIEREKQIKGWRREKKEKLIAEKNPEWKDLSIGWKV